MRRTGTWRLLVVAILVALVALACDSDSDSSSSSTTTAGDSGGTDTADLDLVAEGKLTVCTDSPYEPFEFEEDGEFTGYDMEILRAIAENLGLELAPTVQPFDGIWLAPAAGTCDLVGSAMTITPEREEEALFSDPYFDADQSLLIASDDSEITSLEDTDGKTIGVQTGTTGADYAAENAPEGATLKEFDEPAAMFLAIDSGDIDAILQDFPVNAYRATQDDGVKVTEEFPTGEQYGFATSKDNTALMDAINEQLQAIRDDGTFDTIFETWFGSGETGEEQ
ncbi:MAG: basic amino acid ABC transporter substrate-binding protein [Acidimicrobiia bacterium]|nr:basic amino acid ABC transporter substrate-binding protein [Acidimicrobiia bacterium]